MPLGKRTDCGDARYAGVEIPYAHDIAKALQEYMLCGFDFVVAPLLQPGYAQPALQLPESGEVEARARKEIMLTSAAWGGQIVGKISDWINPDSPDADVALNSSTALQQELNWAAFLGLQAVLLPTPAAAPNTFNTAQIINQTIGGLSHMAIWVTMPLAAAAGAAQSAVPAAPAAPAAAAAAQPAAAAAADGRQELAVKCSTATTTISSSSSSSSSSVDWFHYWCMLYTLCECSSLLGVALVVPADLPPQNMIRRWLAQPLKAMLLPTNVFTTNKRGYPVLSKPHQQVIELAFKHGIQVILTGEPCHKVAPGPIQPPPPPTPAPPETAAAAAADGDVLPFTVTDPGESHVLRPYWEYLCYLFRRIDGGVYQDQLEASYRDYLQAPLQPLQDNLESQTYETFEKDVTKYNCYQAAVKAALLDRVPQDKAADTVTTLMVVGAGRGPLVRASIAAAREAGRQLRVYAVEKNPAAIVHIQTLVNAEGWHDKVTIIAQDMRTWEPPEKADILVSELLGSFGDNELSPECLDGAQRLMKPGGVSIPCSYTSYLAPITSSKLHDAVKGYKDLEHFETPYVVKLHRYFQLSPPQAVFSFSHPNLNQPADNNRSATLRFSRNSEDGVGVLHGLAGYFESVLYPGITLNTHPPTHTPNMFSWFPMYFPLREPVILPAGADVVAHMWRKCGNHKVWYEWAISEPVLSAIHNPGGRSYWVGL